MAFLSDERHGKRGAMQFNSYIMSVCSGELGNVSVVDYLAYILYFPKLLMGPLAGPKDLVVQFAADRIESLIKND